MKHRGHSPGSNQAFFEADNTSPSSRALKGRYEAFVSLFTAAICQYLTGHNSAEVCIGWLEKDQYSVASGNTNYKVVGMLFHKLYNY